MGKNRGKTFDEDLVKKASRLLKGETLSKGALDKYRLHDRAKKKYRRLTVNVSNVNDQWEIDLAEMNDLARYNDQFRYWLVVIDVYSRYCWLKLVKNKTSKNVSSKFFDVLSKEGVTPRKIQCDEGNEFSVIKREAGDYGYTVFHTYNREIKASHVERVIQTLKTMVRRVLTVFDTYRYREMLPTIVSRYNNSPHSSLFGLTPKQVYRGEKDVSEVQKLRRIMRNPVVTRTILKRGHRVRISRKNNSVFEKSSLRRWVDEIFIINKVFLTDPVTYALVDDTGERISGKFYIEELQRVSIMSSNVIITSNAAVRPGESENLTNKFRMYLSEPIDALNRDVFLEVKEVCYPLTTKNVLDNALWFDFTSNYSNFRTSSSSHGYSGSAHITDACGDLYFESGVVTFPSGVYTLVHVLDLLNNFLSEHGVFLVLNNNGKIEITVNMTSEYWDRDVGQTGAHNRMCDANDIYKLFVDLKLRLSSDLAYLLGFRSDLLVFKNFDYTSVGVWNGNKRLKKHDVNLFVTKVGDFLPDITVGVSKAYIYCEQMEKSLVGDSSSELLCVIPIKREGQGTGESVCYSTPIDKKEVKARARSVFRYQC